MSLYLEVFIITQSHNNLITYKRSNNVILK